MPRLRSAAADLVFGAFCPGCGAPTVPVCADCGRAATPVPRSIVGAPLPVVASGEHNAVLRRLIVSWKERGRHGLTAVLSGHLAVSAPALELEPPLTLVPVPTSRRSRRERGADLTRDLAVSAAQRLVDAGCPAMATPALRVDRPTRDQAGLDARERQGNVAHTQRVHHAQHLRGSIVVVDDIWTTGATSLESVRALSAQCHRVGGVAVVAVAPLRPGPSSRR